MVSEILQLGDPRLRLPSEAVPEADFGGQPLKDQVDELIATMRHAKGAGLAANQIGLMRQICVIEVNENPRYPYKLPIPLTVLINPVLSVTDDQGLSLMEGCLSVANLRGRVRRAARVKVLARDVDGQAVEVLAEGLAAGTLQHELDHLDGYLFVDRLEDAKTLTTWANYERYHREAFEAEAQKINDSYPLGLRFQS